MNPELNETVCAFLQELEKRAKPRYEVRQNREQTILKLKEASKNASPEEKIEINNSIVKLSENIEGDKSIIEYETFRRELTQCSQDIIIDIQGLDLVIERHREDIYPHCESIRQAIENLKKKLVQRNNNWLVEYYKPYMNKCGML
jgi:hypothetical protein